MIDIVQRALTWLLTWEVVGLLAGLMVKLGMPAAFAPIFVILLALTVIYKVTSDRYMLQRWSRKFNRWRHR